MKVTPIYASNLKYLRSGQRRIVNQGGMASGKTVGILQSLATLCAESFEPGVTTVTGPSFPHLKGGALRDFEMFVYPDFKNAIRSYHKTDHIFTFHSGDIIEFKVFETEQDARGPKRKRLFVNEANKYNYLTYFQLDKRSNQTIIDYNPSIRFWAHTELIGFPGTRLFISDHRHNPFLSADKHDEIELIKDKELWKVYARGLTGNVTGLIFPNWEMIEDKDFPPDSDDVTFGIDFGYTNDPTTIVKIIRVANTLFIKELCYQPGLPVASQRQILLSNGYKEDYPCYCDGADPDQIRLLRMQGIRAEPARKTPGSIKAGIELLNTFSCKFTQSSYNIKREKELYSWTTDKITGKETNIPGENHNHTFDAIRYAAYTRYIRNI